MKYPFVRLKCKNCGGLKYIGDEYYAMGVYWVDVTCIACSHSKDIEVTKLYKFLYKLKMAEINADK